MPLLKSKPVSSASVSKTPSVSPKTMNAKSLKADALTKPFKHQEKSLKHDASTDIVFDTSDAGCVSADTEFLTASGWKRIDQYTEGDLVGQFHPETREVELVRPTGYVKKPCAEMIAISPVRGMSQRLSAEHRVLYYTPDGKHGVCSAQEYMAGVHQKGPDHFNRKFCTTFSVRTSTSLSLSDENIRLMVAVIADGFFGGATTRCVIRIRKFRKIARLRELLLMAGVQYNERICGGTDTDFHVFSFNAPRREKEYGPDWWEASQAQLEIVADELQHWDSAIDPRKSNGVRFSAFSAASAHFAQYAFSAAKRPASLDFAYRDRTAEGRGLMVEYVVYARAEDALIGPGRKEAISVVPNPEGYKYCFEVPTSFLLLRHNGYIFATGNTGKTAVRILAFAARRKKRGGCLLVLAPKSLLRTVWAADFKKFAPHLKVAVATADNRGDAFDEDVDVYVTNADAVKWLAKQPKGFFDKFSELVIDESTVFKHHTSQRSKAAVKVSKFFKHRVCMTATPNGNTICDVWHQVLLLDGGKRLGSSFYGFRNSVSIPTQVGRDKNALKWEDKEGAEEAVFGLLGDIVIRHKFEDCVDIPANHQYTVPYYLTPHHMKAYLEMLETCMLQIYGPIEKRAAARMKGIPLKPMASVSAIHAGSLAQKLLQISSGAVYESPDKYHVIDTGRYEMILDLIEARKHSLVFFLWKHQRDLLVSEAERRGITFAVIDGSVGERERADIVNRYQQGKYQTLFGHPKTMAHGYTLTKGTATIWSSPTYDLEIYTQGSKRQHRIGQTQKTETISVIADGTREQLVYDAMVTKNVRMTNLLDLFSTL